jgi:hypothetical protein
MNAILNNTTMATKGMLRELKREELPEVQGGDLSNPLFRDYLRNFLDYRGLQVLLRTPGPFVPPRP